MRLSAKSSSRFPATRKGRAKEHEAALSPLLCAPGRLPPGLENTPSYENSTRTRFIQNERLGDTLTTAPGNGWI